MKKQIALLLSAGILASSVLPASAAFSQGKVVSYFDSALGYQSTAEDSNLPSGWEMLYDAGHKDEVYRAKKVDSEFWEGSGTEKSNVIKLNGSSNNFGAAMRYTFDEVIKTGKVHAGFDMKVTGSNSRVRFGGHYVQSGNYNPDDYLGTNGTGYWIEKNTYLMVENEGLNTMKPANSDTVESLNTSITEDVWYRYDLYIDTEARTYDIYLDGLKINSYDLDRYLLKSFWFQCDTGDAYIDNVCFEHYQTGEFDTMKAAVDYAPEGVAAPEGYVYVSFSEKLSDSIEPTSDHFTIKDSNGDIVENAVDQVLISDNGVVELTVIDIAPGTYTIEISDELKGAISGTAVSNTVSFTTVSEDAAITGAAYYLNEDFESYAGGFPTGWGKGDNLGFKYNYTTGDITSYKMTAGEGKNGGKALQFDSASTERKIEYKFPNTIYDGKFTIEFDMYHDAQARWALGLLSPAEYREDLIPSADSTATGYDALGTRRSESLIMSQFEATDGNYEKICTGTIYTAWYNNVFSGVTAPGGVWTHIKLVVDADGNKYTVTATDAQGTEKTATVTGVTRLGRRTLYNTTTQKEENIYGIAGLRLLASSNTKDGTPLGIVKFDNLKVYGNADKAYNLYEDYNSLVRHSRVQSTDTLMYNNEIAGTNFNAYDYLDVTDRGMGDKALKFQNRGNQNRLLYTWLTTPVKAGNSYTVEFDIKNEASWTDQGNTESGATYKGGAWELVLGNWDEVKDGQYFYDLNRVMGRGLINIGSTPKLSMKNADNVSVDTGITYTDGAWQRIQVDIQHNPSGAPKMTVTLKDPATNEVIGTPYTEYTLVGLQNKDITYIGFRTPWNCGASFFVDNLKVYEAAPEAVQVTSVKAIGYDGTTPDITNTMSEASSSIEINLSHPIANANAISLVYPAIGTGSTGRTIDCTKTLSNGGRTVNVTFNTKPRLGEDIAIEIKQDAVFANSYITNFTTYNKVFRLTEAIGGGITVTDFRVYMYEPARTDGNGHVYPEAWVPYFGGAFTDLQEGDRIKLQVKGYNTGAEQKLFMSGNDYTTDAQGVKELTASTAEVLTIPSGTFTESFELPNNTDANSFKGLLWQYPGMNPMNKALEYDR